MAPKRSYSACIFCLKTPFKNPSISLHSFPKDQSKRYLWLTACGLTEEDYKPSRKLCSQHFEQDCFKTGTNLNILKPNSVPTKLDKHAKKFFELTCTRKMLQMSSREMPELLTSQIDKPTVSTVKLETVSPVKLKTVSPVKLEDASPVKLENVSPVKLEDISPVKLETVSPVELETLSTVKLEIVSDYEIETSEIYDIPEQKPHIFHEGDESMPDLSTWRKDKRNLTKARYQIIEQRKKIKYLNLKVSRLQKRLSSMAKSLKDLKKKSSS